MTSGTDWAQPFFDANPDVEVIEAFDKLLLEARAELDHDKRRTLYYEMQRIVRDESGSIIPLFASWVMALSDKLGTADQLAGNWVMDGNKNHERWWFV